MSLPITDLPLSAIVRDLQVRETDPVAVADYAEAMAAGANFPPIVAFRYPDGSIHLADGFHRVAAATLRDLVCVPAEVRDGDRAVALRHALGANRANGVRRTAEQVRQAVVIALREWPMLTQANIAAVVGCSQALVSKIRADVITRDNVATPSTRVDTLGRQQPTSKPRATPEPAPDREPAPAAVRQVDPPKPREPEPAPVSDPAPAPADHPMFDAGDLAAALQKVDDLLRIVEADEKLAEAWRIITELRKELEAVERQYHGAMADRNDLIRQNKSLQRRLRELSP